MAHHEGFGRGKGYTAKDPQPPNDLVSTPESMAKHVIGIFSSQIPHGS